MIYKVIVNKKDLGEIVLPKMFCADNKDVLIYELLNYPLFVEIMSGELGSFKGVHRSKNLDNPIELKKELESIGFDTIFADVKIEESYSRYACCFYNEEDQIWSEWVDLEINELKKLYPILNTSKYNVMVIRDRLSKKDGTFKLNKRHEMVS